MGLARLRLAAALVAGSVVVAAAFAWSWYDQHRVDHTLVLASGARNSEDYDFAVALAKVMGEREPRLTLHVIETFGSDENVALLADDTAQLALVDGLTELGPDAAVVDFLFPQAVHLIARADRNITGVADLRGRIIGLPPAGSTSRTLFWRLIRHYGLGPANVRTVTVELKEAAAALDTGYVDAFFVLSAVGAPSIGVLLTETPATLVPIDQADALRLNLPALRSEVIPKGAYDGARPAPLMDLPSVSVRTLLVARAQVDADDAYELVRALQERRQELIAADLRAVLIERVDDPFDEGLPIHPGAAAWFRRDQPLFVVKYAETLGFLLSATVLLLSAAWQVKLRSDRRAKNRADNYNSQIIDLTERAENAQSRAELEDVQRQLLVIFRRVFSDLDEDLISPTAIQGFTLAWYTAVQIVEHRRAALSAADAAAQR